MVHLSTSIDCAHPILKDLGQMSTDGKITLYHSPNARSTATFALLEELGVPYELRVLDLKAGEQRQSPYREINPMGKVPAVQHGDALITEQVAIFIYLADLFPEAGLAPTLGDPLRGPYLRWMVYYAACFEPAILDRALKRDAAPQAICPYSDYETMLATLSGQLAKGEYLLGHFSSADILWGAGLSWTTAWKLVPELPEIKAYVQRFEARASVLSVKAKDTELADAQGK